MQRFLSVVFIAGLAVACQTGPISSVTPGATSQSLVVVYTKWIPDTKSVAGPEPGYNPAFTGLTSHDMLRASAAIDAMGTSWVVNVTFTPRGADLFRQLTRDNVAACPSGNCAERHLGVWLDLTQRDIDNWDDPTYAGRVSQPYDLNCLANATAKTACPKLLMDAVTLQVIAGGSAQILVATEQDANTLAAAINSASR